MSGFFSKLFGATGTEPVSNVVREFRAKIVGVSHKNADGSSRQMALQKLSVGEVVQLVRDPNNDFDANAVMVCDRSGHQLGFLASDIAERMSGELKNGAKAKVTVSDLTGGTSSKKTNGCNLLIQILSK